MWRCWFLGQWYSGAVGVYRGDAGCQGEGEVTGGLFDTNQGKPATMGVDCTLH